MRDEDPDNDHALYMLAVAHAQRDEHAEAHRPPRARHRAEPGKPRPGRTDPDLEPLRDDEAFRAALETPPDPSRTTAAPPPAQSPNQRDN